jgi:hypothetical protein
MTEDPKRTFRLLWDDHLAVSSKNMNTNKNKNNTATLTFSSVSTGVSSTVACEGADSGFFLSSFSPIRFLLSPLRFALHLASISSSPRCDSFISREYE